MTNEITPVLTYSYMVVLVPAFLMTDLLRYKPVLIIQGLSQVVIWLILLLGSSLLEMQLMEFFYGITMACRVAYSSYIFSLVSPGLYQRVAGYSRASVLFGVFTSSVLGQLCMSVGGVSYYTLSAISLGFVCFGLLLAMLLPWPKRSLFFNRTQSPELKQLAAGAAGSELDQMNPKGDAAPSPSCGANSVFVQMLLEVKNVVKRPNLRLWCLWWVFNSTGYYLVLFYVHILWNKVYPATENRHVYNGGVEAASTLLSETRLELSQSAARGAVLRECIHIYAICSVSQTAASLKHSGFCSCGSSCCLNVEALSSERQQATTIRFHVPTYDVYLL